MRSPLISLMASLLCLAPAAAGAEGPDWTDIDPEPSITRCWAISQDDRDSGVTVRMAQGTADTVDCLKEEIIHHATEFFATRNKAEIRRMIADLDRAYAELYWVMYNENKGCDLSCGSMHHVSHVSALAVLLEDLLRDLVAQRNRYEQ